MVFLSDDAKTYSYVGDLINEAVNQQQHAIHTFKLLGLAVQARFVRLQIISGGYYVFVDEIEVLGVKTKGLAPKKRDLMRDAIKQFAKNRIPLLRQKNSSLTFLGLALARVAAEPERYQAAANRTRTALQSLRPLIMARSKAEKVDFRRGAPFTKLDTRISQAMWHWSS